MGSPLHIAAHKGHDKIVRLLVQHHPDCNDKDSDGATPLMLAVAGGYMDVVGTLLRHGARVADADAQARSSLHWAVLHRLHAILRALLDNCLGLGEAVNAYDVHGRTPLHTTIDMGFEAAVDLLLRYGANTQDGGLPLVDQLSAYDVTTRRGKETPRARAQLRWLLAALAALAAALLPLAASAPGPEKSRPCRYLPGDREWPSAQEWNKLNRTVGGRLIIGVPRGPAVLNDPVNVIPPYFENNTCDPFVSPEANALSLCQLGNLASYAINVTDAATVAAGLKFAKEKNIRLVVKNTGHDYLGRSSGKGSLALWTHNLVTRSWCHVTNLKEITFLQNYTSRSYNGTAVKLGAGVQVFELYKAASDRGLRVVGGSSCPTVDATGGWRQAGGYGPLISVHGLGADNSLAYEVVTVDGRHLTASPQENADLFWALSGGGAGNYAFVLSAIVKTHQDGPVAGSRLAFLNTNSTAFYAAVEAWMKHMLHLDTIPGFAPETLVTDGALALNLATLPGGSLATHARGPGALLRNPRAARHRARRQQLGRAVRLPRALRRTAPGYNAVTPAWRNNLFLINLVFLESAHASWATLRDNLARANFWQDRLRELDYPGGGAYVNEGSTFDNAEWKADYFGGTYDRLRTIEAKWDPASPLYVRPGVGADEFTQRPDGRLCKV
ncbi:hypothetical protein B0T22DRAFT_538003 [Podospora appendiculata]|uniref:FAD-binding PCMH-type domain-containing protein n=1 Tax=Podospora appendiculata TaxID=314037 RepID=A0AAE1CAM7_9PEZI|nr:hypothetical protein B0T22DRAFT_538003 [Podospora appendiculata]